MGLILSREAYLQLVCLGVPDGYPKSADEAALELRARGGDASVPVLNYLITAGGGPRRRAAVLPGQDAGVALCWPRGAHSGRVARCRRGWGRNGEGQNKTPGNPPGLGDRRGGLYALANFPRSTLRKRDWGPFVAISRMIAA
jgi:hypothetical protein